VPAADRPGPGGLDKVVEGWAGACFRAALCGSKLLACEELSEAEWALVAPHLPAECGRVGRPSHDNRRVLNGILWVVRSGARWIDVPERYVRWNSVYHRCRRWSQAGVLRPSLARWRKIVCR